MNMKMLPFKNIRKLLLGKIYSQNLALKPYLARSVALIHAKDF